MLTRSELRGVQEFMTAAQQAFDAMVGASKHYIEILFDEDESGAFRVTRADGKSLGKIAIGDSGEYEFMPEGS